MAAITKLSILLTIIIGVAAFGAGFAIRFILDDVDGLSDNIDRSEALTVRINDLTTELENARNRNNELGNIIRTSERELDRAIDENRSLGDQLDRSRETVTELRDDNRELTERITESRTVLEGIGDGVSGDTTTLDRAIGRIDTIDRILAKYGKADPERSD